MLYFLFNDGKTVHNESDSSMKTLLTYLNDQKKDESKMKSIINWYIITRLLYLLFSLQKAKLEGKELEPIEFFLSQVNGGSKQLDELFIKIIGFNIQINMNQYDLICSNLINEIENFECIKKNGFSIAMDEAGVANQLFKSQ
jgi:hypothetical protein